MAWRGRGRDKVVLLPDGRRVGLAVWGDPDGATTVLAFHGTPGSRLADLGGEPARARGVRILAPDRPGHGLSDPAPPWTVASYVDGDVRALLDALQLDEVAVLGWSGGAPYALAAAVLLGGRVRRAALCGPAAWPGNPRWAEGMARSDALLFDLARRRPGVARGVLVGTALVGRFLPRVAERSWEADLSPTDRSALPTPTLHDRVAGVASLVEACRQGAEGVVRDHVALAEGWGFDPGACTVPVDVWQGTDDAVVPLHHAEDLAARIPTAALHVVPGGHLLPFADTAIVLDTLLERV